MRERAGGWAGGWPARRRGAWAGRGAGFDCSCPSTFARPRAPHPSAWVSVGDSGCGQNGEQAQPLSWGARPSNCPGSIRSCSALHPKGELDYAVKQLSRNPADKAEKGSPGDRKSGGAQPLTPARRGLEGSQRRRGCQMFPPREARSPVQIQPLFPFQEENGPWGRGLSPPSLGLCPGGS